MTVTYIASFAAQEAAADGITVTGTVTYSTSSPRTGPTSLLVSTSPSTARFFTIPTTGNYVHFGLRLSTVGSGGVERVVFGDIAAGTINVRAASGPLGTFSLNVYVNTTLIGSTGSFQEANNSWYWIGVRQVTGTSVAFLQVGGADAVVGTATVTALSSNLGTTDTTASNLGNIFYADLVVDDTGFLESSNVIDLLPTADSAVGTGWTLGTGTAISANSGSTAVKNEPPVGVADLTAGSDTKQIRNATSNANVNYDATMQTYTVGGLLTGDTVIAVRNVIATAAPVTTSSKQGTVGNVSNPTVTNIALGAGGTAGAFWSGVAAGTYPTGWKASFGTLTTSPSVTLGTAPVMRVTQVTSSTRIAMVCYMALRVAWTPARGLPPESLMIKQAAGRASIY